VLFFIKSLVGKYKNATITHRSIIAEDISKKSHIQFCDSS